MEIKKIIKTTQAKYDFFCDKCNKYLGSSLEYDDGYYENLCEYEQKFYLNGYNDWLRLNINLCDKCKDKMTKEIVKQLKQ